MVAESWSWEDEKAFENALAIHYGTCSDWWGKIEAAVPEKGLEEIKNHYEMLVKDVISIQSGRVPLPDYESPSSSATEGSGDGEVNGKKSGHAYGDCNHGGKGSRLDHERRKGIAWSEEEHRLFLLGLEKYGKGNWRSISRNLVISRTPTQVASHAQKYFIRLNATNKDRRRSSIHDITSVSNDNIAEAQGPITGQGNSMSAETCKASEQPSSTSSAPEIGVYGATIRQPVGGPLMPAVGTPVAGSPIVYGVQQPTVPRIVVASAPFHLVPMAYPMPSAPSQR